MTDERAEQDLVRLARSGDRSAFAQLVERYWDRLRQWLCSMTQQSHQAEDLTQEAFLKAWVSLPNLQEVATFRVWLFRIAKHAWLDSSRGPRGRATETLPLALAETHPGPLEQVLDAETQQMLQQAIERLPPDYRATYWLWTREHMPYAEIAAVLGITEQKARWRVFKARSLLVKALRKHLDLSSS